MHVQWEDKRTLVLSVCLPLFIIAVFLILSRNVPNFEFDPDEGFNLMKALLVQRGHPLYVEVFSDQPPLFTYALVWVFRWFSPTVEAGRALVLLFSWLLLWSAFRFLALARGVAAAVGGVVVIALLPQYSNLSFSVMIGLPALSLAMLALAVQAQWHQSRSALTLAGSALLLALSVMVKTFTLVLVPVFIAGLLLDRDAGDWKGRLRLAAVWAATFMAVVVCVAGWLIRPENLHQLWLPHELAADLPAFQRMTLGLALRKVQPLLAMALLGGWVAFRSRKWLMLYPMAWMLAAVVGLWGHRPVWPHQQLLVSLPAALLVIELFLWASDLLKKAHYLPVRYLLACILILLAAGIQIRHTYMSASYWRRRAVRQLGEAKDWQLTGAIRRHASRSQWVVTDRPIYAFRAGLLVPPTLAVISRKRVATGLGEAELAAMIAQWRPEQVVLVRFRWPSVRTYLEKEYRREGVDPGRTLFFLEGVSRS